MSDGTKVWLLPSQRFFAQTMEWVEGRDYEIYQVDVVGAQLPLRAELQIPGHYGLCNVVELEADNDTTLEPS